MHEKDETIIRQITGIEGVTPAIAKEYAVRLSMYHRGGGVGELGLSNLIPMLRDLGVRPPRLEDTRPKINPTELRQGDRVMVTLESGEVHEVTYNGGIPVGGGHGVRFDGSDYVHEVKGHQLSPVVPLEPEVEAAPEVDWLSVDAKTRVIAQVYEDGPPLEGEFVRVNGENLKVKLDGDRKHYSVPPEQVALA